MIDKPVTSITKGDIDALVQSGRMEDRAIEYKRDLPGSSDDERREFLRDVSSFANGLGGDILYGIEESGGLPTSAHGKTRYGRTSISACLLSMLSGMAR